MAAISLFGIPIWPPWRHVKTLYTLYFTLHLLVLHVHKSRSVLKMALVIFSKTRTNNTKQQEMLTSKVQVWQDKKRREKHTPKIKVFTKNFEKKKHKLSFRPGLRCIFASGLFGFRHAGHALLAKTDQWNGCNLCNGSKLMNQSQMAFRELRANCSLLCCELLPAFYISQIRLLVTGCP